MKKDDVIILMNGNLSTGGIETYYYNLARYASNCGSKIILWINKKGIISENYMSILQDKNIMILKGYGLFSLHKIKAIIKDNKVRSVRIISCDMFRYDISELIKRIFKKKSVHTFLFIPHFLGKGRFFEEGYSGPKKQKILLFTKRIISKMFDNGNLLFFDKKHIEVINEKYGLNIDVSNKYIVPLSEDIKNRSFDKEQREKIWEDKNFKIISISRFEFPHKGYIIGLIRAYALLKNKYSGLKLDIVGYGEGLHEIKNEIKKLSISAQKDLNLLGEKNINELEKIIMNYNLNISLAGCYNIGASRGVLSIPARHYSYTCEVYGFSPEANEFSLSSECGEKVEKYIELAINMPKETYIDYCKRSFESIFQQSIDRNNYFDIMNKYNLSTFTLKEMFVVLFYYFRAKYKFLTNTSCKH